MEELNLKQSLNYVTKKFCRQIWVVKLLQDMSQSKSIIKLLETLKNFFSSPANKAQHVCSYQHQNQKHCQQSQSFIEVILQKWVE